MSEVVYKDQGHSPAALDFNHGQRHGRCYAYGIMNQSSLPCFLALILAQKCGIDHPDVLAAIEQTGTFFRSYIAHIPRQDLPHVADPVTHVLADQDRSYHSYHNLVPHALLIAALGKHRVQEGLEAALATYQKETGKYSFRARMFTHAVPEYGAAAKPLLTKLRELHPGPGRFEEPWNEMLETIESATDPTVLVPLGEFSN